MDAACQNGKIATDAFNVESGSGPVCKGVRVVRIVYPHGSTSRKMLYSDLYLWRLPAHVPGIGDAS
jgi:hypothetical protein